MTKHCRFNETSEITMPAQASAAVAILARGNRRDVLKTRLMQSVFFLILIIGVLSASTARAGDAGLAVFVTGKVEMAGKPLALNSTVAEGAELSTGADGYVYIKTIDNGFFILRPNTRARIVTYHVDQKDPINTRIKLELITGVARSISGEAVKLARQNFRFNTPVAAIGVRGTDFVVYTTQETSRIAVVSGGVVASAFVSGCAPQGFGPCEGGTSTELFARQQGQLLQVTKEQNKPQLLQGSAASPDAIAPPRPDEPSSKVATPTSALGAPGAGSTSNTAPTTDILDPKKVSDLKPIIVGPVIPPVVTPPVVTPPVVPELPAAPQIIWGRWGTVAGQPQTIDFIQAYNANKLIGKDGYYALFRAGSAEWQAPTSGTWGFALTNSDAYVTNQVTGIDSVAKIQNGTLNVDFSNASFVTNFDLLTNNEVFKRNAQGRIYTDGQFTNADRIFSNTSVNGVLTNEKGGSAAYTFQSRLDDSRVAYGITLWGKKQ